MKLTNKDKDVLHLALILLDEYYDKDIQSCRNLTWIRVDNEEIEDIQKKKMESRKMIINLINS